METTSFQARPSTWLILLMLLCRCSASAPDSTTPYDGARRTSDPDVLARAAVVIGSCIPDDGVNRSLSHIRSDGERWWHYGLGNAAACIAAAGGGCDALHRCIGLSLERATAPCTSVSCEGERATGCGDGLIYKLDCAKLGLHCDEKQLCSAAPSVSCDLATFPMRCGADGIPEYCARGVMYHGANCPALGLECAEKDCVGGGESCLSHGGLSDGDMRWDGVACVDAETLRACVGGRVAERSCPDEGPGFTCQSFEGKFFCGIASECVPAELPNTSQHGTGESCDGDTLVFCNAGRVERIACKDLGFMHCDPKYRTCGPAYRDLVAPD